MTILMSIIFATLYFDTVEAKLGHVHVHLPYKTKKKLKYAGKIGALAILAGRNKLMIPLPLPLPLPIP